MESKKIFFAPLGCAKNQVDGELMLGRARAAGHEIVAKSDEADVLVVNTCAFIDAAREESVNAILALARTSFPDLRVATFGEMSLFPQWDRYIRLGKPLNVLGWEHEWPAVEVWNDGAHLGR